LRSIIVRSTATASKKFAPKNGKNLWSVLNGVETEYDIRELQILNVKDDF
jgi:hypothetical protein